MSKTSKFIVFVIFSLFILTLFTGCSRNNITAKAEHIQSVKSNSADTFNLEQFQDAMRAKGYHFEIQDAENHFLPATKKKMRFGDQGVNIYLFNSNEEMENVAKGIDHDGSGYSDGSHKICLDWAYQPRFYKRGTIIVQCADNEKIISDLKDILGEPFVG
jgi:hypothetical protein